MIDWYVAAVQMITQYFDMLKDVGSTQGNSTIFLNHSPGSLGNLSEEVSPLLGRSVFDVLVWSSISANSWSKVCTSSPCCSLVHGLSPVHVLPDSNAVVWRSCATASCRGWPVAPSL